jgi:hypothetical protein
LEPGLLSLDVLTLEFHKLHQKAGQILLHGQERERERERNARREREARDTEMRKWSAYEFPRYSHLGFHEPQFL